MSWFKVDDGFHSHAKVMTAGTAALGLWVRCGSWSARHLTNGRVPANVAREYGSAAQVKALVASGLWAEVDGGYQFHDFTEYNPTADEVNGARDAAKERQRKARDAAKARREAEQSQRDDDGRHNGVTCDEADVSHPCHIPPTRPDPTRPDPKVLIEPSLPTPTVLARFGDREQTAATLLAEWINACGEAKPPDRVKGQVAKQVGELLREGQPYDRVRAGLARWHDKRLSPSLIPSVVHEVAQGPPVAPNRAEQRTAGHLALIARLEAQEAQT